MRIIPLNTGLMRYLERNIFIPPMAVSISVGELRENLSEIMDLVRLGRILSIKIKSHGRVQAYIVPNHVADVLCAPSIEVLQELRDALAWKMTQSRSDPVLRYNLFQILEEFKAERDGTPIRS